jgi:magnesium transporter
VERLGAHFGIHPLVLEDIVNTNQRPKLDLMGDYLFVVFRMLTWDAVAGEVRSEQVSLILGQRYVLTFQERAGDVFDPLRERIRKGLGRIRKGGADYLAYALLDVIVDNYFVVVEQLDEQIESLESRLVQQPSTEMLGQLNRLKRQALYLRKSIWPLREAVAGLQRRESPLIGETTALYLRDLYDHVIHVIDTVETLRDLLAGMLDVYLSGVSNRMNEVMKVLTVISTIFIPLTFIVGVYGMNFEYMPELHYKGGYPLAWGIMLVVAGALVLFFRRRRWL